MEHSVVQQQTICNKIYIILAPYIGLIILIIGQFIYYNYCYNLDTFIEDMFFKAYLYKMIISLILMILLIYDVKVITKNNWKIIVINLLLILGILFLIRTLKNSLFLNLLAEHFYLGVLVCFHQIITLFINVIFNHTI